MGSCVTINQDVPSSGCPLRWVPICTSSVSMFQPPSLSFTDVSAGNHLVPGVVVFLLALLGGSHCTY